MFDGAGVAGEAVFEVDVRGAGGGVDVEDGEVNRRSGRDGVFGGLCGSPAVVAAVADVPGESFVVGDQQHRFDGHEKGEADGEGAFVVGGGSPGSSLVAPRRWRVR